MPKDKIIIWPSNRIPEAYLETNYLKNCGTLGNSCMRHKKMQKALQFYVKNKVKIAVILEGKKISARALLWENVYIIKYDKSVKVTYLDRVYYSKEEQKCIYRDWALKNNYITRENNNYNIYKKDIILNNICHLPYADTFRYLYKEDGILASSDSRSICTHLSIKNNYLTLSHTANYGYTPELDKNSVKEVLRNDYISKKDAIYIKKYDGYVLKDHILDVEGEYFSHYDTAYIVHLGGDRYAHKKYIVKEAFTNQRINKLEATKLKCGYILNNNLVKINNIDYSQYDPDVILCVDTYYLKKDCFRIDSTYIPKLKVVITYNLDKDGNFETEKDRDALKVYYDNIDNSSNYIELNDGTLVNSKCKNHLVKYNNKYYLKNNFKKNDVNQLYMFGLTASKAPLNCL